MTLKQKIYEHYRQVIAGKIDARRQILQELTDSAGNETKSSAGDKYETGRAMLHMEQDNNRKALAELMAQKAVFNSINPDIRSVRAGLGSLVKCSGGYYFLSIALGRITVEGHSIIALSPLSPLGSRLMGLKAGNTVLMNGTETVIERVE